MWKFYIIKEFLVFLASFASVQTYLKHKMYQ